MLELAALLIFPAGLAYAASSDLTSMTLSNKLNGLLGVAFFALVPFYGLPLETIALHVLVGLAMLVIGFGFFSRGWIGGGDAKLLAVIALWLGWSHLYEFVIYSTLLGGALTIILLQFNRMPLPMILARQHWIARLHALDTGIPYGIALAAAGLIIYPGTFWITAL